MKKVTTVLFLVVIFASASACKKKKYETCDQAELCVVNNTGKTLHYAWGSSYFTDSILPGQKACKLTGAYNGDPSNNSTSTVFFQCDRGSYAWTMASCNDEMEVK